MPSPDEVIAKILHADVEYDPAKRREYYLRTRELKGRTKGDVQDVLSRSLRSKASLFKPSEKKDRGKTTTETRIAELKARLEKLRKVLKELGNKAKARSGVETETKKSGSGSDQSGGSKKSTAKEKAAAKDYYEKHKKDEKNRTSAEEIEHLRKQLKEVRSKIKELREKLAKAEADNSKTRSGRNQSNH